MDLDELRDALNDAGRRTEVDEGRARDAVGARLRRHRRNRRVSAAVATLLTVAAVVGAIIAVGNHHSARPINVTNDTPPVYANLPSRSGTAMAYDGGSGKVVLFGGAYASGTRVLNDTWLWDGHGWSAANPVASPPARTGAVMSYDESTKQLVLFGGTQPGKITLDDTWTWDGTTWTQRHPRHQPPLSSRMAMSYDPASHSTLLLALPEPAGPRIIGSPTFETWRWNGTDWHELDTPAALRPGSGLLAPRLTPLANGAGLLLYSWANDFGSRSPNVVSETWTWDGSGWTQQHPSHAPALSEFVTTPGATAAPTVFLPERGIWRWTGSDWAETKASGIGSDGVGFAVYDAHDSEVVAYAEGFTGRLPYATWTWDGSWVERDQPTGLRSSTTTVAAAPDPLPAGSVMLGVSGRTISALDSHGAVLKTLVTAFAGRTVENAQLMPDHRTIWYATKADDNQSCPEIVKLDLQTNARTVVAHASDFSLTPDGSKLLLVWPDSAIAVTNNCRPVPYPGGVQIYDAAFVVRHLATGAQSTLAVDKYPTAGTGSPSGHVWISPSGDRLIDGSCVVDGCGTHSWVVPPNLDGPISSPATDGPRCGCSTLISGPDGVYGVDQGGYKDPANFLRRYDPTNLTALGTQALAPPDGTLSSSVAPTTAGVFVLGVRAGSHSTTLYRVDNNALRIIADLGPSTSVAQTYAITQIYPIPPLAA
jgi:hypothetical protein